LLVGNNYMKLIYESLVIELVRKFKLYFVRNIKMVLLSNAERLASI